jgi:superfamily II DNA or RNA helicase
MTLVTERVPQILRPRQIEAVEAVITSMQRGEKPICAMGTGMGKTTVIAETLVRLINPHQHRALVVAHTQEIIFQLFERIANQYGGALDGYFGFMKSGIGIVMGDHDAMDARIVIATRQSLHKKRLQKLLLHGDFDMLVIDECFPGNTQVDGKPIRDIQVGDSVTAFDETTGQFVAAKVTYKFVRPVGDRLCRLVINGEQIVCTPNHPFLTRSGWKPAASLTPSDFVYQTVRMNRLGDKDHDRSVVFHGNLRFLRRSGGVNHRKAMATKTVGARLLFQRLRCSLPQQSQFRNHDPNKPRICRESYAAQQSHEQSRNPCCGQCDAARNELETAGAWRERQTHADSTKDAIRSAGVGNGTLCVDAHAQARVSIRLQDRHCQPSAQNSHRGGWQITQGYCREGARLQKGGLFAWVGVDSVEVLESRGDREFGGLCPEGLVYNLEVETFHTYTANGVVVHNCHHAAGDNSYAAIINTLETACPRLMRFGTTATPFRGDGVGLISLWTNICYEFLLPAAVQAGELAPPVRVPIATRVDASSIKTRTGDYAQGELVSALEAENWQELCLAAFEEHITADHLTMAFMPTVAMSQQLVAGLNAAGRPAAHVDGTTPDGERTNTLKAFAAGEIRVLSNFGIYLEGADVPNVNAIFLGRPTRSRTLLTQIIGRGVRLAPGKTHCLVVDMTVLDTKAIQFGSLIGRMVVCRNCGSEFHSFLDACPACNTSRRRGTRRSGGGGGERVQQQFTGKGLVAAAHAALVRDTYAQWHIGVDGLSCMISFQDGTFVVLPPDDDGFWRLYHVSDRGQVEFKDRSDDAREIVKAADDFARKTGGVQCDRRAKWRAGEATESQISALKREGISTDDVDKGKASALLAHTKAMKRLLPELERRANHEPHWVLELYRTGDGGSDRDRMWRVIDRVMKTPGAERVKLLVKGGEQWGTSERELPHVRTTIDETMIAYFESEQIVAYPE